jgi:capsular polysaccharide biosynthesis protein
MHEINYMQAVLDGWKRILLFAFVSALFGAALSFLFPLQYSSTMRLNIIQKQLSQADPYTAIKASERISDNLSQIVYTTSFFDKVMAAQFNIDRSVFKTDDRKRRQQWSDMIGTTVVRGSGMLVVTVYHKDVEQATQIARAIAFVLTTDGSRYVGGGDLEVQLVDEPLQSRWPVKPNIPANAFAGFVLGMLAGAGQVAMGARKRSLFSSHG